MSSGAANRGSALLVGECFDSESPQFVAELRKLRDSRQVAAFVDRWKRDPRPWARHQILAYLDLPLNSPGHHPLVKRLFKQAEQNGDDELLAAFMVAFDRLIRRFRRRRRRYEWIPEIRQSQVYDEEILQTPRNSILPPRPRKAVNPRTGEPMMLPAHAPRNGVLFSYHTRRYLRRRVWRYFRRLGHQRPADYTKAICRALKLYRDDDLSQGESILDSWSLVHICFGAHPALEFTVSNAQMRADRNLAELNAAPRFLKLWQERESAVLLMDLIFHAQARLVRVWARQLIEREHAKFLGELPADELLRMLDHQDAEIQQFAAGLLTSAQGLASWPLTTWLRLLETKNPEALATICEVMARNVDPARLDLAQCVKLASADPTPVARLGLEYLTTRSIVTDDDRATLTALARARCAAVADDLTRWALNILGRPEVYQAEQVSNFFDSLSSEIRDAAWHWLITPISGSETPSTGYNDPVLWSRLLETPWDDQRLRLVEHLRQRASLPGTKPGDLRAVWCTVLLGVHRGGRQKAQAVQQIAHAIAADPAQADSLLPVLAVAVRSVRPPELRAGLAALMRAVEARPELAAAIERHVPELSLSPEVAAR